MRYKSEKYSKNNTKVELEVLNTKQAAYYLRVSIYTIRRLAQSGKLKGKKKPKLGWIFTIKELNKQIYIKD